MVLFLQDGIQQKHSCGLVATGSWEELSTIVIPVLLLLLIPCCWFFFSADGVRITYTGGHEGRSSVITYQCNPAATVKKKKN